jgi:aminoglycoside 3-N-acetyltransferase
MNCTMFTVEHIKANIADLGLRTGDSVIVHCAYKKTGGIDGGAEALLETLIQLVGPDGALLLPNLNIPGEFTADNPPRFDVQKDPIRHMIGILPEVFKYKYAEYFSLHPTHALTGIGGRAPELLSAHEQAGVPCGAHTPWDKNARTGGKILLIGVNQHSNTTYHSAEEHIPDPYQLTAELIPGTVIFNGEEIAAASRLHRWCNQVDFNIMNEELESQGILRTGKIGNAEALLINAKVFLETALAKLAQDRDYFRLKDSQ